MALFFFGNNFGKNKETFKIFSPQILDVYRILLVLTTLESIMIYYTFSVINTMFVPCTELLYDSTAATRTIKLFTTLLSISCAICLISFPMMSFLVCGNLCQRYSSVLFKVVVWNEVVPHFSNRTLEYLRHNFPWDRLISRQTNDPWSSYSQDLNPPDYFQRRYLSDSVCENNPQKRQDMIRKEIRLIAQKILNRVVDNFIVRVAAHTAA